MGKEKFAGHKKKGKGICTRIETNFENKYVSKIPNFIETYHLTYMTIIWSALIVFFGFLAIKNINWLWLVSLMIVFQYLTDLFDGAVGRYRDTGLIKWGYYMDHFLDYIFLGSILITYLFLLPSESLKNALFNLHRHSWKPGSFFSPFKIYQKTENRLLFIPGRSGWLWGLSQ